MCCIDRIYTRTLRRLSKHRRYVGSYHDAMVETMLLITSALCCKTGCSLATVVFMSEQVVKLKAFSKFANTTEALAAASALVDSKLSKSEHHR